MEKHEFALYVSSLSSLVSNKNPENTLELCDEKLLHRMMHVLRLQPHSQCILFDRDMYVSVEILSFARKQICVKIDAIHKTIVLQPVIIFLLPVLKRDDLEGALYALAELGVTTIQLVFTQKTVHQWSEKERERAERILIAAAEQSKNFSYPVLKDPIALDKALEEYGSADSRIFFDFAGKRLLDVAHVLSASTMKKIVLLVGPEGDLNKQEKEMVLAHNFVFCALTPTILRAIQAVSLGAGFIRSIT